MASHRFGDRIEALKDAASLRRQVAKVQLGEATKNRIRGKMRDALRVTGRPLVDDEVRQLVDNLMPTEYRNEIVEAGVEFAKSHNRGRAQLPLKRYLKTARAQLHDKGLTSRQVAEALYAAGESTPVGDFEVWQAEAAAAGGRECKDCNERYGGFHFHSWDECPLNPEND